MINHLKASYRADKLSFFLEFGSFFFLVIAGLSTAILANDPPLAYIYPIYFIGATLQLMFAMRRNLIWLSIMSVYFCGVDILGFTRAIHLI